MIASDKQVSANWVFLCVLSFGEAFRLMELTRNLDKSNKVITTMVIMPLDDPMICHSSV